jgi:hypothetical protein
MKPVSAMRSSSSSKQLRQGGALKYSRRQQPPKPPASSVFGVAMEWIWNAFGYSSSNPITSKERSSITRTRSKSPAITPSSSMEDDWQRAILQQNDLKKNDADFFDIAQDILLKGNSVTLSGISPSSAQFQQTMNPYIANLLKEKNIEPNDFIEALQYRAGKIPMFVDPSNQTKLISVTSDLASLLHVKALPDTDYSDDKSQPQLDIDYTDGILERPATKTKFDGDRQGDFFYPPVTAPITEANHSKAPPLPSEPLIPPLQHPPIQNRQTIESFMRHHSFPEQANSDQGYRQHHPQHQRYDTSAVMPQQRRFTHRRDIPSVTSLWPHQGYSTHISPRQLHQQQKYDDVPEDIVFPPKNSMMEDVPTNTPYHLGLVPLDEEEDYGDIPPLQRQQIFLSQERQKVMLEIYNVTELVSRTLDDPVMNRMYKNRLLNLQNELESLFDGFPSTNIVDAVKSDLEKGYSAENKSVASAATILKANPKETKSVASTAAISAANPTENKSVASIGVKSIRQEMQGSEQRVVKKAVEGKKSPSSTLERKHSTVKSVIVSPTAEQILASTYHEAADEGLKHIIAQEMTQPSTSVNIDGERQVLAPPMKKDDKRTIGVIKVKAPMTMPEGYSFEAKVGEKVMMIKVPKGGVKKGQIFDYNAIEEKQMFIPLGRWRYPIFSCCVHGIIHPMCCNGFLCPQGKRARKLHHFSTFVITSFNLAWFLANYCYSFVF